MEFLFRSDKKALDDDLNTLVKQRKTSLIKSIVNTASPSDFIDCRRTTLLHLAIKYNNTDLIDYLLKFGYDINARNLYGRTPLLAAVKRRNFRVIKMLLDANANVLTTDWWGQSPVQLLTSEDYYTPASVTERLVENLKRSDVAIEKMAYLLVEADCPVVFLLRLKNADLLGAVLRHVKEISMNKAYNALLVAMNYNYLDNIRALLHYGHKASYRRQKFLELLSDLIRGSPAQLEQARPYLEQLVSWKVIDDKYAEFFQQVFEQSDVPVLRILLNSEIDKHVLKAFGRDLLVHMHVNRHEEVIDLIVERNVDPNRRGKDGRTALHLAAMHTFPRRIKFLLDRQANPNIKDRLGRTPLLVAWDPRCIELLLRGGADIQVIEHNQNSIFHSNNSMSPSIEILLAHLAVLEARNVTIKQRILDRISSKAEFKEFFAKCQAQVQWMIEHEIRDCCTIFTVLTKKPEDLVLYVRDSQTAETVLKSCREKALHDFYICTLEMNFSKILKKGSLDAAEE